MRDGLVNSGDTILNLDINNITFGTDVEAFMVMPNHICGISEMEMN